MAKSTRYDVLIIGGGQAGIPLAHALAKADRRVALAEPAKLGGSCGNFGCTPTKAAFASARLIHLARRADEFGLKIPELDVDYPAILERARGILEKSRGILDRGLETSDNPKLVRGHARFEGRDGRAFRVVVGEQQITAAHVVLDTGTRSRMPPIDGLDQANPLSSENWLNETDLPAHLAIVGGGYIGLEMSQFYRRLGCRVTVIEKSDRVADREDVEVASALKELLESEGIEFRLNTRVTRVESRRDTVVLTLQENGDSFEFPASRLFIATGRKPNTDDLGLEQVRVKVSDKGFVAVDDRLATNVECIWATGDIRGGPMFTHTAWDDYRVLLSQLTGGDARITDRIVPYAIFTDPELGRVGMTESEAKRLGKKFEVVDLKKNGRAVEIGETTGFIKVVVERETKRILGAAVLATEGADLVHLFVDLMNANAPYTAMRDAVHSHPTLARAVQSAVSSLNAA